MNQQDVNSLLARPAPTESDLMAELAAAKARVAELEAWIKGLDLLVENTSEHPQHRDWHGGEVGWVYPGHAAYYGDRREAVLAAEEGRTK